MAKKRFALSSALTEALSQTVTSAKSNAGSLKIEIIGIAKIDFDPENPRELVITRDDILKGISQDDPDYDRKVREFDELQSLANSIKGHGILNPIVVCQFGDRYRLIAGERRCLASLVIGNHDIKATIFDDKLSVLKQSSLQWIENIERSDLKLCERISNLRKIVNAYQEETGNQEEITPAFFKELIGCSWTNASHYHSVLNADDDLRLAIEENKVNNLEKAAFIAKLAFKELQVKALQACIDGEPLKNLKEILAEETEASKTTRTKSIERNQKKRGREATQVKLGSVKNTKIIKELTNLILENKTYSKYREHFVNCNWDDFSSVSKAFQTLIRLIEKHHVNA